MSSNIQKAVSYVVDAESANVNLYSQFIKYILVDKGQLRNKKALDILRWILGYQAVTKGTLEYTLDSHQLEEDIKSSSLSNIHFEEEHSDESNADISGFKQHLQIVKSYQGDQEDVIQDQDVEQCLKGAKYAQAFVNDCIMFYGKDENDQSRKAPKFQLLSDKVLIKFYYYLFKSILSGEYIILDNFTSTVESCNLREEDNTDKPYLEVLQWYPHIQKEIIHFCGQMCLPFQSNGHSGVGLYIKIGSIEDSNQESLGALLFTLFRLTLIMSSIDLRYYSNDENRASILHLLDVVLKIRPVIKKYAYVFDYEDTDYFDGYQTILDNITFKASQLLKPMLTATFASTDYDKIEYDIIAGNIKAAYDYNISISEGDPKLYDHDNIDERRGKIFIFRDLNAYNKYVESINKKVDKVDEVVSLIQNVRGNSEGSNLSYEYIKVNIEENIHWENFPYDFFRTMIPHVFFRINNNDKKKDAEFDWADLFIRIITMCRQYIQLYKSNITMPLARRKSFEKSFVRINKDKSEYNSYDISQYRYDIQNMDANSHFGLDYFFFASLHTTPADIIGLETIVLHYVNRWQSILVQNNNKFEENLALLKDKAAFITDYTSSINEKLAEERKQTIQILGIFAAMLAFVASVIGLQTIVHTALEFTLYCCMFVASLLIFVVAIKYISHHTAKSDPTIINRESSDIQVIIKEDKIVRRSVWIIIFMLSLVCVVLAFIYYNNMEFERLLKEYRKNPKQEVELTILKDVK